MIGLVRCSQALLQTSSRPAPPLLSFTICGPQASDTIDNKTAQIRGKEGIKAGLHR